MELSLRDNRHTVIADLEDMGMELYNIRDHTTVALRKALYFCDAADEVGSRHFGFPFFEDCFADVYPEDLTPQSKEFSIRWHTNDEGEGTPMFEIIIFHDGTWRLDYMSYNHADGSNELKTMEYNKEGDEYEMLQDAIDLMDDSFIGFHRRIRH